MKLQNPDVLEATDVGYCMDKDDRWYRWKDFPIAGRMVWAGIGYSLIHPEAAPKDLPKDFDWRTSWQDNPNYVKGSDILTDESAAAIIEKHNDTHKPLTDEELLAPVFDEINKAEHYNKHPSGVECIRIIEHFQYNIGAAIKYLWRAGEKHDDPLMDLEKAEYYVKAQIALYHKMKE